MIEYIKSEKMNNETLVSFQRFNTLEQVESILELFSENDIPYEIENVTPDVNPMDGHIILNSAYLLKIPPSQFEKAKQLLSQSWEEDMQKLPPDYYLFSFTDAELEEILAKPDEWNPLDFELARKILSSRGKNFDGDKLRYFEESRLVEKSKPERGPYKWIMAGYVFAFVGGIFAIPIGYGLVAYKKTLPDGSRVNGYEEKDRDHGYRIMVIGAVMLIINVMIFVRTQYISEWLPGHL